MSRFEDAITALKEEHAELLDRYNKLLKAVQVRDQREAAGIMDARVEFPRGCVLVWHDGVWETGYIGRRSDKQWAFVGTPVGKGYRNLDPRPRKIEDFPFYRLMPPPPGGTIATWDGKRPEWDGWEGKDAQP